MGMEQYGVGRDGDARGSSCDFTDESEKIIGSDYLCSRTMDENEEDSNIVPVPELPDMDKEGWDRGGYVQDELGKMVVHNCLRVDVYGVLSRAVDEGITWGYTRAHKHNAEPSEETIRSVVHDCVMTSICEVFRFE